MSTLTFRNKSGELIDIQSVPASSLDALGAQFDDLLARMQTTKSKKGMDSAFNASPRVLGRAAVKAARK